MCVWRFERNSFFFPLLPPPPFFLYLEDFSAVIHCLAVLSKTHLWQRQHLDCFVVYTTFLHGCVGTVVAVAVMTFLIAWITLWHFGLQLSVVLEFSGFIGGSRGGDGSSLWFSCVVFWCHSFFFFNIFVFSIIVDLQCSVSSCHTAEWPSCTWMYTLFFSHYPPSCSITSD